MTSIVTKKQGNNAYMYTVESAPVDGKPRIVSQTYLGFVEEVLAKLTGAEASSTTLVQCSPRFRRRCRGLGHAPIPGHRDNH